MAALLRLHAANPPELRPQPAEITGQHFVQPPVVSPGCGEWGGGGQGCQELHCSVLYFARGEVDTELGGGASLCPQRPHISASPPQTPPRGRRESGPAAPGTGHRAPGPQQRPLGWARFRTRPVGSPHGRQRASGSPEPQLRPPRRTFAAVLPSLSKIATKPRLLHHRPVLFPLTSPLLRASHRHPPASSHRGFCAVPQLSRHAPPSGPFCLGCFPHPQDLPGAPSLISCMLLLRCHHLKEVFPSHLIPSARVHRLFTAQSTHWMGEGGWNPTHSALQSSGARRTGRCFLVHTKVS